MAQMEAAVHIRRGEKFRFSVKRRKHMKNIKCELFHDNFQNYKRYNIPKAQLVITDIPYNLGTNAYASNLERSEQNAR